MRKARKLTLELTERQVRHVLNALVDIQATGDYYGNSLDYYKRTTTIIEVLRTALRASNTDGVSGDSPLEDAR
jgi:hypothetical protein